MCRPEGGADGDIPDAEEAKIEALAARLSTRAHLDTCVTGESTLPWVHVAHVAWPALTALVASS